MLAKPSILILEHQYFFTSSAVLTAKNRISLTQKSDLARTLLDDKEQSRPSSIERFESVVTGKSDERSLVSKTSMISDGGSLANKSSFMSDKSSLVSKPSTISDAGSWANKSSFMFDSTSSIKSSSDKNRFENWVFEIVIMTNSQKTTKTRMVKSTFKNQHLSNRSIHLENINHNKLFMNTLRVDVRFASRCRDNLKTVLFVLTF